ncbi:heme NO-binding domain-containing protein [uncultured Roseobacter sp.]|uniref:heme NO-binding domain-containing protein n=1 Tax=uncultured Roseobacter sp. TaxID=114847 RepID=UPI00261F6AC9|nr:heme NO-binding domain-containing protein [uncultured Roseobacter sp.]
MYGLVNNGVRTFIVDSHGEETWRAICSKACVPDEEFENLTAYDDAVTYALVSAVSDELGLPAEKVLEVFGSYWVGFSKSTAIGKLVDHGAETLIDRIRGLDEMHERIQMTMPHLDPPSFEFEEMSDGNHRLHYMSNREGLAPMVVGLLKGMADECGVEIDITHAESREDGATHDIFLVRIDRVAASAA